MKYSKDKLYCIEATASYKNGGKRTFAQYDGDRVAEYTAYLRKNGYHNIEVYEHITDTIQDACSYAQHLDNNGTWTEYAEEVKCGEVDAGTAVETITATFRAWADDLEDGDSMKVALLDFCGRLEKMDVMQK